MGRRAIVAGTGFEGRASIIRRFCRDINFGFVPLAFCMSVIVMRASFRFYSGGTRNCHDKKYEKSYVREVLFGKWKHGFSPKRINRSSRRGGRTAYGNEFIFSVIIPENLHPDLSQLGNSSVQFYFQKYLPNLKL
jgi:hypothetical protein